MMVFFSLLAFVLVYSTYRSSASSFSTYTASKNTDSRQPASHITQATSAHPDAFVPPGCTPNDCKDAEPFGTPLGMHGGVVGYSNCASETCISDLYHTVSHFTNETGMEGEVGEHAKKTPHEGRRSGMKWQCVEYARRYWMLHGCAAPTIHYLDAPHQYCAATFGDVDGAEDIWSLEEVHVSLPQEADTPPITFHRSVPLLKVPNAKGSGAKELLEKMGGESEGLNGRQPVPPTSLATPRIGDLLLYARDAVEFPYGHVAVIVGFHFSTVDPSSSVYFTDQEWVQESGFVFLAEQNWDNKKWISGNYSRMLSVVWEKNRLDGTTRRYHIHDTVKPVMGWVRPCLEVTCVVVNE